jgi:hypothetical protein
MKCCIFKNGLLIRAYYSFKVFAYFVLKKDLRNLAGELNHLLISIIKSTKKNNNIK